MRSRVVCASGMRIGKFFNKLAKNPGTRGTRRFNWDLEKKKLVQHVEAVLHDGR